MYRAGHIQNKILLQSRQRRVVMWELVSIVGFVVSCCAFYKLGQHAAWNYIAKNYIAIHKSAVIGPILIKNKGGISYGNKNKSNRTHKKAFTQQKKYH